MSDQGMANAGGGPLREVDLAKGSRTRRSGSASEGSWITPPPKSAVPVFKRAWFLVCATLLVLLVVVLVALLAI